MSVIIRFGVALRLDDCAEDLAILIDGPPQPVLLSAKADHHRRDANGRASPASCACDGRRSPVRTSGPSPDRLVQHDDPALEQHLLNQLQAQWEPEREPYRVGDDLGWKAVAFKIRARAVSDSILFCGIIGPVCF